MIDRVFLIVMDSFGIGNAPDEDSFGDKGANTLKSCYNTGINNYKNLAKLGLFNIDGVTVGEREENPIGAYGRLIEKSNGKDTTVGHWEIAGIVSERPLPTFPNGFPLELINKIEQLTNRKVICNKPYSGTEVIKDYGMQHLETGSLIVYTSQDSVLQIAVNTQIVPLNELYDICRKVREILVGEWGVGRVIARPFVGNSVEEFKRTSDRHDFSILPPQDTMLDVLKSNGYQTIAIGKINDIFAGKGITQFVHTKNNDDGVSKILDYINKDFKGLCFANLVDYDMLYGHRNDAIGYARAVERFDGQLEEIMNNLKDNDIMIITADHGCDPSDVSTDHTRECVPLLIYGKQIKKGKNLGTMKGFLDICKFILDIFEVENGFSGASFFNEIYQKN